MEFAEQEISQLTETIWGSVLGLEVRRIAEEKTPEAEERYFSSCVQITGEWEGAVILHCPADLARSFGAIMYDVNPENETVEEIKDALGELTNMLAGNVKALLPGVCHISLPAVVEGFDYTLMIPGSQLVSQVPFECQSQPFMVMLLERDGDESEDNSSRGG